MNSVDKSIKKISYYSARLHQNLRIFLEMRILCFVSITLSKLFTSIFSFIYAHSIKFFVFLLFIWITFMLSSFPSILFEFKTERLAEYSFWAFLTYFTCLYFFRRYAILQFLKINYTSSSGILFTIERTAASLSFFNNFGWISISSLFILSSSFLLLTILALLINFCTHPAFKLKEVST